MMDIFMTDEKKKIKIELKKTLKLEKTQKHVQKE